MKQQKIKWKIVDNIGSNIINTQCHIPDKFYHRESKNKSKFQLRTPQKYFGVQA